ncbi:MAG: AmmeMemoRadiSam system protein B [Methanomassiliicoccaceae archaeon]|nr:AmmeMemoRadiSam system protein B [Methanomassiliicoccaceae archaeon]
MRYPVVAGRFYPNDEKALTKEIESCFTHNIGPGMPGECRNERRLEAVIAPHAGYKASGMNAAHVYKEIAEDGLPDVYVVIGPDHYGIQYDAVLCGEPYVTPLGACKVHDETIKRLRKTIPDDVNAHKLDHSVEAQIPFIQYIDPDAHIVPIIMGDQSQECAEFLSNAVSEACSGYDHIVIASSDLSHYVPKDTAFSEGKEVMEKVCGRDVPGMYDSVYGQRITICGYGPMAVAMMTRYSGAKLLKYSDSYDSLGVERNSVVGYASAAFYR